MNKMSMSTLEEYESFITLVDHTLFHQNNETMKWMGLEENRRCIQRDLVHLAYYTEESKTNPLCIYLRDRYKQSIKDILNEMVQTILELKKDLK
jgi:hypothetical protein